MKPITDISQLDFKKQYTYADYLTWRFEECVELIKGWLYKMSPALRRYHQKVEGVLHAKIWHYFENSNCEVYQSPFDVRLKRNKGQNDEIDTVVQPDICVVCDLEKLNDAVCHGASDLIVEFISSGTVKKDYNENLTITKKIDHRILD